MKRYIYTTSKNFIIIVMPLLFIFSSVSMAEIYKWKGADGKETYSDYPPLEGDYEIKIKDNRIKDKSSVQDEPTISSGVSTSEDIQEAKNLALKGKELLKGWDLDIEAADRLFKKALSLDKNCADAYFGLSIIALAERHIPGMEYDRKPGDGFGPSKTYPDKGSLEKALRYAEKAVIADDRYIKSHKAKGYILALMGRHNEALNELKEMEKIDASSCDIIELKAGIYRASNNFNAAIAQTLQALSCQEIEDKRKSDIYGTLAILYLEKKDYRNAEKYYRKQIEIIPETALPHSAWAYGNCGMCLLNQGKLDEAEVMVKKALSLMDYGMAHEYLQGIYFKRGRLFLNKGDLNNAENQFALAIAEGADNEQIYNSLINIYARTGNCNKGVAVARRVLHLYPYHQQATRMIQQCENK